MSDIVERLNAIWANDDHDRGCQGREYSCSCGYDNRTAKTAEDAATEISRLRQLLSEVETREREARVGWAFAEGDLVRKKTGSWWEGRVVGTYTTKQTQRGYAVQLDKPFGPVQIYPESALESALQSEER